jgi:hypothetical protein
MPLHVKVELFCSGIFENRMAASLFIAIFEFVRSMDNDIVNIRNEFNVFRNRINEMIKYQDIFQGVARALK